MKPPTPDGLVTLWVRLVGPRENHCLLDANPSEPLHGESWCQPPLNPIQTCSPPRKPADEPTGRSDVTTDTILVLQDGQVACDFLVLALISPNWLARFPSEDLAWSASDTPRVLILPDVTLADMETLLELLYVGQTLPLPLDRIHALKRLTQMLQCRPLSVSKIAAHPLSDGSATPPDWPEKPAISSANRRSSRIRPTHPCTRCSEVFDSQKGMRTHFTQRHRRVLALRCDWPDCPQSQIVFRQYKLFQRHVESAHGVAAFRCPHCEHRSKTYALSRDHVLTHTNIKRFPCSDCHKTFRTVDQQRSHMMIHKDPDKVCDICGQAFKQRNVLYQHRRRHFPKTLVCPHEGCEKRFSSAQNLRFHIRIHTQQRPYRCETCRCDFLRQHHYKKHLQTSVHLLKMAEQTKDLSKILSLSDVTATNTQVNPRMDDSGASQHYIFNNECQAEAPPSSPKTSVRISYIDEAEVDVEEDSHQGGLLTIVSSPKPSPKHRRPTRIHVGAVPISKVPPDTYVHWTNCFQGAQRFAHKPCPVCNQIFLGLHPLIAHLKAQHANQGQNNRLVTCHICQTQCDSGLDLHHHLRMHFKSDHSLSKTVSNRQYLCLVEDCNYVSQSVRNHKAHMANVHQRKPFQCHQCGDEFVSKANLKVHESSRHSPLDQKSSFQCVKCDRHFKRKSSLTSHVIDQHQLKPEDRTLSCPICKIDLKGRRNLLKHQKIHQSQEKQFQCSFCPKLFLKHNGLVVHERIHTGEMPFECEICGVKFKRSHHLNFHLKSNSHAANVKDAQRTQNQSDQGQGAEPDVKSIT
ncbi:hypothetical protein TCAL_15323 [Tigriopus californicus]|uniref:BTB domain-containing protein n=1 Tax=Tigriopus californicus TaxID=6832 RepID=A0A553PM94_TIGCA|nr:hypothetical protein TCAL_15323 [Tigriopus californicus]